MSRLAITSSAAAISLIAATAHASDYSYSLSDNERQQVRQCFAAPSGDAFAECVTDIARQSLRAVGPQVIALLEQATTACTDRDTGLDQACAVNEGPAIAKAVLVALQGYAAVIASEPPPDAAFSFSPACWHPSGAHLCALLTIPASDNE
jgi:hypothetical protein